MNEYSDNPEVDAMAVAYRAIMSQPFEAHERMLQWLTARLAWDQAHPVPPSVAPSEGTANAE